jgi:NADP-dependent 3-hydroxy acid dehydrogenase YdfG
VGAGSRLGRALATTFGNEGFDVALVARRPAPLAALAEELAGLGVSAAGFAGDVTDADSIAAAFAAIKDRFGPVDVLEYSPAPQDDDVRRVHAVDLTVEDVLLPMQFMFYGAINATRQVLPDMLERGKGTLLYTTGASSRLVLPTVGTFGPPGAALRQWALALHRSLAPRGVYVAHVPLGAFIGNGDPENEPDVIARTYWDLHCARTGAEHPYGTLPQALLDAV